MSTAEFVSAGERKKVTREQVEAAAARLVPAHSTTMANPEWFALVGPNLYYVVTLVEEATGHRPSGVKTARLALHELKFPILCYAWNDKFVNEGHPWHRGT
ncbi:hypothetical protein [Streptomyces sp. NPDC089915]|uniref:hypothetical protein n=1 Tax=Streptomyces sp. NPDC089915 TaxID=3155186 RepID=UPI003425856A